MPQERVRHFGTQELDEFLCLADPVQDCLGKGVETDVPEDYVYESPYSRENMTNYVCDTCKRGWFVYAPERKT